MNHFICKVTVVFADVFLISFSSSVSTTIPVTLVKLTQFDCFDLSNEMIQYKGSTCSHVE